MDYKAIKIMKPGDLQIVTEHLPEEIGEDDVLIQVKAAGVCGSDVGIFKGTNSLATYPRIIGHEIAGEVVKAGTGAGEFQKGDHVVIDPVLACGHCYACGKGRPNVCDSMKVRGVHTDGGFAEYTISPKENVYKVSDKLSFEEAALVEPFSVAAQVLWRGEITGDDTVLINGCGPIGLIVLQACKVVGARCIVSDLLDSRLERAKSFGADYIVNPKKDNIEEIVKEITNGSGVNKIVDAVGVPAILEQSVRVASNAGIIVTLGFTPKFSSIAELDITKKELDIRGSRLNSRKFPQVIEWFEKGLIQPKKMISHEFAFEDIMSALKLNNEEPEKISKIILKF
nr:zinc-binding alcohol dehydrogenase family protein [uncultured Caproiciproducens sp.]